MEYQGRKLIEYPIVAAQAWHPFVVCGAEVAAYLQGRLDVELVRNDEPALGMSHSLALANERVAENRGLIVLLGDMPQVTERLIRTVLSEARDADFVYPDYAGIPGHPVVLSSRARRSIADLPAGDTLRSLRCRGGMNVRTVPIDDPGAVFDIDTSVDAILSYAPEPGWKAGAVMLPIFAKPPHQVIFVERSLHMRRDPGHIALPGGETEPCDASDPVRTALRELCEEVGVSSEHVRIVGRLHNVKQPSNRFDVTPVVGVLSSEASLSIDEAEIAGILAVPLESIVVDGGVYEERDLSNERGRPMYALDYEGRHIWGLTARILKAFVESWNAVDSQLRAALQAQMLAETNGSLESRKESWS